MSYTVVVSGGGTAGHINPAIALAERLEELGCKVYYAGTPNSVEARLVPMANIPFKAFEASGFNRRHPLTLLKGVYSISKSTKKAIKWFDEIKPDAVVGFGGYVSIPVVRAAEKLGVPVILHEQNSVMGMANKSLAKKAQAVCLTYEDALSAIEGAKAEPVESAGELVSSSGPTRFFVTGNPVRKHIFDVTREEGRLYLGIPEDAEMLLVFGGSRGARHINEAVARLKDDLLEREGLYIVHIAGPKEVEEVASLLSLTEDQSKRYILKGYEDEMPKVLAAADAIVSRSGATSLAEISALRIPALLVPFPFATADHQRLNARSYVEAGAAEMVLDNHLDDPRFEDKVLAIVDDEGLRQSMRQAASEFGSARACDSLADVVMACIKAQDR